MRNLFLDTNILVDLVCHREPFVQEAKRIFALAYSGRISIVICAMDSDWNDFEDSVQYNSSLSFSADYIITRNPKDFVHSTIPVYTPTEFLQIPYWMEDSGIMTVNEPME